MTRHRRLWAQATLLFGLALLLGCGAGEPGDGARATAGTSAAAAPARTASVSSEGTRVVSATSRDATVAGDSEALEPRHPEVGFRSRERLTEHFRKHGREFRVKRADDYLRLAQILRDRPRGEEVLEFVRNDAVTCKFDRASGAFVAYNSDGTLRTFFKPRDGEAYFERQKSRAGDAP